MKVQLSNKYKIVLFLLTSQLAGPVGHFFAIKTMILCGVKNKKSSIYLSVPTSQKIIFQKLLIN